MASLGGAKYRQDMPPPGGYEPISFKRVPSKSYFSGVALIGAYLGMTAVGYYLFSLNVRAVRRRELEMRSASHAIYPMVLAERDRAYLKQLRKNRDEESNLMANVEGWKTGTLYGEPIYYTKPEDFLVEPIFQEYYVHTTWKSFKERGFIGLNS